MPADGREDQEQLNILLHSKLTVGRTVSSLYILRDLDGSDGAFFVFSDISVRAEGNYRLRMCLFNIKETTVNYNLSVLTEPFTVYSAKTVSFVLFILNLILILSHQFPGMYRSCPLVQNFAKQGLKIRIRKESGPRPSRYTQTKRKSLIKASDHHTSEEEEEVDYTHASAFKRVMTAQGLFVFYYLFYSYLTHQPYIEEISPTISNKRRLSLSYLLDLPEEGANVKSIDSTCQLAPITTTPTVSSTHHASSTTDLPPIQQHFMYMPKSHPVLK